MCELPHPRPQNKKVWPCGFVTNIVLQEHITPTNRLESSAAKWADEYAKPQTSTKLSLGVVVKIRTSCRAATTILCQ